MTRPTFTRLTGGLGLLACGFTLLAGCHSITCDAEAIPASRLPRELQVERKDGKTVFPPTTLGQDKPVGHRVGPGDQLSIYVHGVMPPSTTESMVLQRTQPINQRYYPPHGSVVGATTGLPVEVDADGAVDLPLIGRLPLEGKTLAEATEAVKIAYRAKKIVQPDNERVHVSLVSARVHRVIVLREDTPSQPVSLVDPGKVDHIHRGSGEVIDLPAYENDVLHALAATGGLPGTDAAREIWVFKRAGLTNPHAICPEELAVRTVSWQQTCDTDRQVIRIPLTGCPGEGLPFDASSVILAAGDVVYLPRRNEYFSTGGLLQGARIPLPRDEDIDIVEAIALATGSVGGPLGHSGQTLANGRPGYMIKPTRVIILRELPDGTQLPIQVDLARAMENKQERLLIQHKDVVMLHFKTHEATINGLVNWVNPSILFKGDGS